MKTKFFKVLLIFSAVLVAAGCSSAVQMDDEDGVEPIISSEELREVPFTEYILLGTQCFWVNQFVHVPEDDWIAVVNSKQEFEKYFECWGGSSYPEIDFSKHSLLIAGGYSIRDIFDTNVSLLQRSKEYTLNIDLSLNEGMPHRRWTIALVTDKISDESAVELNVTTTRNFQIPPPASGYDCESMFYYYFSEKISFDHLFVNDWLLVGFDQKAKDDEIVDYINQTGFFKPVDASDIWYHARWEADFHMVFVNTIEQKTCTQLMEIIRTLQKAPIVAHANLTFEHVECVGEVYPPTFCTNIGSVSHVFYVKVKNEKDLTDLYAVMQETNTWLIRQNEFMPDWFVLGADKYSIGNAMRMSQYFYETNKFVTAEPDIIGHKVSRYKKLIKSKIK